MLLNYIKIALRNLFRQRGYSLINIIGLAIGIAGCILILLYVKDELSYDRHNAHAERIYRIGVRGMLGGNEINQAITSAPMAAALVQEFPEVEQATRFRNYGFPVLRYGEKAFSEEYFYAADSTFFDVFTVTLIEGDPATALSEPNTLVLTRSMAEKYFGAVEEALGKVLEADRRRNYRVTAVIEDFPRTSHFQFDFVTSLAGREDAQNQRWISHNFYTYVLLREGASPAAFEEKLQSLVPKYVGPQIEMATGMSYEQLLEGGNSFGYFIQPLTSIHLYSNLDYEIEPNGDATYVYVFSVVALAILLIACINFMNLATAKSVSRAKEVGIRKTLGSNRTQLVLQFLAESIFMSLLAFVLALLVVQLLLPTFNDLSGKDVALNLLGNAYTLPLLLGFAVLVGILSGSYPAFFLASFKPVTTLKGNVRGNSGTPWLRSALVIFQFTISIMLFVGTFIVHDQLDYIRNKKLGFNQEQVVIVEKTDDLGKDIGPFREALRQHPGVLQVSSSNTLPGKNFSSNVHKLSNTGENDNHLLQDMLSDHYFREVYQIEMAAGRYFSPDRSTDTAAAVINETAAEVLGLTPELAVGKEVVRVGRNPAESRTYQIIGVTQDFHFESLHQEIRPLLLRLFSGEWQGRYLSARVSPDRLSETLAFIEDTWQRFAGDQAFEYVFFDDEFAQLYESETRTAKILNVFSGLAIFIACLGLFGLASFTTAQRTKEIGIRKVMGATVSSVILLLGKEFAKWVLMATVIAWPLAYLVMADWLKNFAYQTDIRLAVFLIAAGLALLTALVTVSYQTIKAAMANPADSLRYE